MGVEGRTTVHWFLSLHNIRGELFLRSVQMMMPQPTRYRFEWGTHVAEINPPPPLALLLFSKGIAGQSLQINFVVKNRQVGSCSARSVKASDETYLLDCGN